VVVAAVGVASLASGGAAASTGAVAASLSSHVWGTAEEVPGTAPRPVPARFPVSWDYSALSKMEQTRTTLPRAGRPGKRRGRKVALQGIKLPRARAGYVLVKDDKFVTVAEPSPSRMTRAGHRITERPGPTPKDRISGQPMNLLRMLFHRIRPADVTMSRLVTSTTASDGERSTTRAPTTTLDTPASEGVAKKETLAPPTRLGV